MAEDVLFVETSTYEHDYKLPDKKFYIKALAFRNEPNLYNNDQPRVEPREQEGETLSNPLLDVPPKRFEADEIQRVLERRPKSLLSKTLGNVALNELSPEKREEFLSYTYRTTYSELAEKAKGKIVDPSCGEWDDREEDRLKQVMSTKIKPVNDVRLSKKAIETWAAAQPRCQRGDNWFYNARTVRSDPFPDYPQALVSSVGKNRLKSHFDSGRVMPGYTGFRKRHLEFPENVDDLFATGHEFCDTHGVPWNMAQDLPKYVTPKNPN